MGAWEPRARSLPRAAHNNFRPQQRSLSTPTASTKRATDRRAMSAATAPAPPAAAPPSGEAVPWAEFEAKMAAQGLSRAAVDAFKHNYEQLVGGATGLVRACRGWRRRSAPPPSMTAVRGCPTAAAHVQLAQLLGRPRSHTSLPTRHRRAQLPEADIEPVAELPRLEGLAGAAPAAAAAAELLAATAVLKLNGGLGTSMGLERAKSLLPVKDGASFLDLIARQVARMRAVRRPRPLRARSRRAPTRARRSRPRTRSSRPRRGGS